MQPGASVINISLSPEGGDTKKVFSGTPSGLKNQCAFFTPGFNGGHKCLDPSDLPLKLISKIFQSGYSGSIFRVGFIGFAKMPRRGCTRMTPGEARGNWI